MYFRYCPTLPSEVEQASSALKLIILEGTEKYVPVAKVMHGNESLIGLVQLMIELDVLLKGNIDSGLDT